MVVFLIRTAIFLGSAALGIWVASLLLADFTVSVTGFVVALAVFVVAQWILSPLILKLDPQVRATPSSGASGWSRRSSPC